MSESIGDRIRKARDARGMTQGGLALQVGSKSGRASTVSEWESGNGPADPLALAELVAVLRVDAHWLLTGEGEMERSDPGHEAHAFRVIARYVRRVTSRAEVQPDGSLVERLPDQGLETDGQDGREAG
jgi:transcriptional regulator with XRE-family HTH domain